MEGLSMEASWMFLQMSNTTTSKNLIRREHLSSRATNQGPEVSQLPLFTAFHIDTLFSSVAAEYLARGYTLSDSILQRAIEIDSKSACSLNRHV